MINLVLFLQRNLKIRCGIYININNENYDNNIQQKIDQIEIVRKLPHNTEQKNFKKHIYRANLTVPQIGVSKYTGKNVWSCFKTIEFIQWMYEEIRKIA